MLWAISAFHTVPFSTASTAQPTPKGLHRGRGGRKELGFSFSNGCGEGGRATGSPALLLCSAGCILFPHLLQLYSTY